MGALQSVVDSGKRNSNFLKMDDTIFINSGSISGSFGDNSPMEVIQNRLSKEKYLRKSIIQGLLDNCLQGISELKDTPDQ
jgi:hypothetical protein